MSRSQRRSATALLAILCAAPIATRSLAVESRRVLLATPAATSDQAGTSVATIGDFNGDGYDDFVVGAPNADSSGTIFGRAFIFFGGPGADSIPDYTLRGEAAGDSFGFAVAGAGDMNGDGRADVLVGAPGNDAGGTSAGRAYVYFGAPYFDGLADVTFTGSTGESFGYAVAGGRDFNGDGFDDVVTGAPKSDLTNADGGRAYLYLGGAFVNNLVDGTFGAVSAGAQTGYSVTMLASMNGDRFAEVALGSPFDDVPGADAGRVDVYLGGVVISVVSDLTVNAATAGDEQGYAVADAGDVNGDGISDLLVGSPFNDATASNAGRAQIFLGGTTLDNTADLTMTGLVASDQFGWSVGGTGDVNGDGFSDVLVGAPLNDLGATNIGSATLFLGSSVLNATPDVTVQGRASSDQFGYSVGGGVDIDGDGLADMLVGAPFSNTPSTDAGDAQAYSVFLEHVASPNGGETWVSGSTATVRWLGRALADIALSTDNGLTWSTIAQGRGGDDDNTLVVNVPIVAETTSSALIRVNVANATPNLANSDASDRPFRLALAARAPAAVARVHQTFSGSSILQTYSGTFSVGDVNGDGFDDFAFTMSSTALQGGRVLVFFGGSSIDAIPDMTLTGPAANDGFGAGVAGADLNADGFDDLIVTAPYLNSQTGGARVYFGGAAPDTLVDATFAGFAASDYFGNSGVAPAGDVNRDGAEDVLLSAPQGSGSLGYVLLVLGGTPLQTATLLPPTGVTSYGYRIGGVGDMNGDGYDDFAIGDGSATSVLLGAPDTTAMKSAALRIGEVGSLDGGDVDGDGFADLVLGGYGGPHVYRGGPTLDGIVDAELDAHNWGGLPATVIGDANEDGFDDIVVNSYLVGRGEAWVYFGGPAVDEVTDMVVVPPTSNVASFAYKVSAGRFTGESGSQLLISATPTTGPLVFIYDISRYHLTSPIGGETWNVGALRSVRWLGAELADIRLSVDGGQTYDVVASGVGGQESNAWTLRVPHSPTKFARVSVVPHDPAVRGVDASDSSFTIQSSVALLSLAAAPAPEGGVQLTWSTDPVVGPEGITGYRVYRIESAAPALLTPSPLVDPTYRDPAGTAGTTYQVSAVNGLGEELVLGETSLRPLAPLAAWPVPYRRANGPLTVSYRAVADLGGASTTHVALYDARGRLVRTLVDGVASPGQHETRWDGRDDAGRPVANGVFTLRLSSAGDTRAMRVLVLR